MVGQEDGARERIVLAAIACIERLGLDRVTVRAISGEADVNVAAINYYFGSKDSLIEHALETTLHNAFSLEELYPLLDQGMEVRAALEEFLVEFMGNGLQWPGLAEAHLHGPMTRQEYPERLLARMTDMLQRFRELLAPRVPDQGRDEQMRSAVQFWNAVMMPILVPGLFADAGVDFHDANERRRYIRSLITRHYGSFTQIEASHREGGPTEGRQDS